MAAHKAPARARLTSLRDLRIVACYPRAVRWLCHGAGSPLPESRVEILNIRTDPAEAVVEGALREPAASGAPAGERNGVSP